jgi:N-acetylglucosaminyldiphosphoundecaprenol N-acetyl-beta-D-mannosaminyltransferase
LETSLAMRVQLLNVPVDALDQDQALKRVESFLLDGERHQIVFLNRPRLLAARGHNEYRRCLREASLILPVSSSLVRAARFLRKGALTCYSPFTFVIRLLSLAERFNRTVYLLGGRKDEVEKAERNLRDSFRGLRLVGRHAGYYPKSQEKNVLLAIKKASPTFLLVGGGLPGRDLWVLRRKKELTPGIYLWVDDCFELFSGKKKSNRPPSGNLLGLATGLVFWLLVFFARIGKR